MAVLFKVEGEIIRIQPHPYGQTFLFDIADYENKKTHKFELGVGEIKPNGENLKRFQHLIGKYKKKIVNHNDLLDLLQKEYLNKTATFVIENHLI